MLFLCKQRGSYMKKLLVYEHCHFCTNRVAFYVASISKFDLLIGSH